MNVFGRWGEAGEPKKNTRIHGENKQTPYRIARAEFEQRTVNCEEMSGDSAHHHTTKPKCAKVPSLFPLLGPRTEGSAKACCICVYYYWGTWTCSTTQDILHTPQRECVKIKFLGFCEFLGKIMTQCILLWLSHYCHSWIFIKLGNHRKR